MYPSQLLRASFVTKSQLQQKICHFMRDVNLSLRAAEGICFKTKEPLCRLKGQLVCDLTRCHGVLRNI